MAVGLDLAELTSKPLDLRPELGHFILKLFDPGSRIFVPRTRICHGPSVGRARSNHGGA